MKTPTLPAANRILIIDDNPAIHGDFRKILAPSAAADTTLRAAETLLFGPDHAIAPMPELAYQIDSASQGQEGLRLVEQAAAEDHPYALAFVDVRMPPGWDGIETIKHLWAKFPDLPVVICTAYSDYSWSEMMSSLGHSDNLVILRKPFEAVEVLQLAHSLTRKWLLARQVRAHIEELDALVQSRTRNLQEANEALRRSEERFAKAFRANPAPLALLNVAGQQCVDVNESFLRLAGFTREAVLGRTPAELKLFPKPETTRELLDALAVQRPLRNRQAELITPDQRRLVALISTEPLELDGQPHILMSLQDITDRVAIENQLRQAQKMEVVGQIAAGVAHDFNNILTVIQGHAELQLSLGNPDESLVDSLREISRAAARAASLTRQLLAFSRKQVLNRRPLDLAESLENLGKMLRRIIGENITLRIQCAPDLPPVLADAVNVEQIVINLSVNARDAMPRGGPLTITAEPVVIDVKYLTQVPDAAVGTFVRLSVADEGVGMDETVRAKIFEPFFTTKEVGKGTGMGLATVYGIVKQHQGWVEVESQPGAGSVFKVYLPVAEGDTQLAAEAGTSFMRMTDLPSRTILLVEDEAALREMASKVLKRLGHQVVEAQDGPEALNLWPQYRGQVDLLLTDLVMPGGLTGRELADRLLGDQPRMRVIYSTGYGLETAPADLKLRDSDHCLPKPYDATALIRAVRKAFTANGHPVNGNSR